MELDIPNQEAPHLTGTVTGVAQPLATILGGLHSATRYVDVLFEGEVRVTYSAVTNPSSTIGERFIANGGRRMSRAQYSAARAVSVGGGSIAAQVVQFARKEGI